MQRNRHHCCNFRNILMLVVVSVLTGCSVYTVDKQHLENRLKPGEICCTKGGLNKLLSTYKVQYNNHMDTISCVDERGLRKTKKVKFDSRITIVTRDKQYIKLYAKTLYI